MTRVDATADRNAGGLVIEDLCFAYERDAEVVCGLSLNVAAGEVHAVLGPSGCGKSTLLRLIAGLERPRSGRIEVGGRCVAGDGVFVPAARRRVGVVFQDYALFPTMTAAANVRFAMRHRPRSERHQKTAELLDLVGMNSFARAMPFTLSGGQQQRIALARALARDPIVMLLDEPFASLDPELRQDLAPRTLSLLRERGIATVLVTHHASEANAADAQTFMPSAALAAQT
ncbi:MAG: ATP-binding cassette domain-containing protein [Phycisphaerales bacterium]|jgi:iron(III) transport system ATP-binding protein